MGAAHPFLRAKSPKSTIFFLAGAAVTRRTFFTVGTTNAFYATLLGSNYVSRGAAHNQHNNRNYKNRFPHNFKLLYATFLPFNANSAFILFLERIHNATTIATITATAAKPQTAGTIASVAGAVINVPTVYTK